MTTVDTFKARRRLDFGGGRWREYSELVPEAHTWFSMEHMLHVGELERAEDVSEEDFLAAIEQYCPELREEILPLVGLADDGTYLEASGSPRLAPLTPQFVPATATPEVTVAKQSASSASDVRRAAAKKAAPRRARGKVKLNESTIVPTDVPPGMRTPGVRGQAVTRAKRQSEEI